MKKVPDVSVHSTKTELLLVYLCQKAPAKKKLFKFVSLYIQMVILALILKRARIKALVKDKRSTEEAFGSYVEVKLPYLFAAAL